MATGGNIGIGVRVDVETKQAQKQIKDFERSMSTIEGQKTVFINAKIEGADEIKKKLSESINNLKGIKFDNKGVMTQILGIDDARKALGQLEKELSKTAGRARNAVQGKIGRVSAYIGAYNEAIELRSGQISGRRAVNTQKQLGEYYNSGRQVRLSQIDESVKIARQNGDYREQLSLLKEKAAILEKIDKTNRAKTPSPELAQTKKEIEAIRQKAVEQQKADHAMTNQRSLLSDLTRAATRYFSIFSVAHVVENMAKTAGYFQQQQVALEGILGSATKAKQALDQIKALALESPFQTKELVTYTKQLSAFGVDSEKLVGTMKDLADISAGLGVDMGRLILAYGQVKSAAVLRGQELRQFTEAGIPMVEALSKKLSEANGRLVTTGEVFKYISERKVPFEMVASVLSDMTAEGGKFYKMQENLTDTLYGQIEKLKDVWTLALNDVGGSWNNLFRSVVDMMATIIKHAKAVFAAISGIFAVSGVKNAVKAWGMMRTGMSAVTRESHRLRTSITASSAAIARAAQVTGKWEVAMIRVKRAAASVWAIAGSGFGMIAIGAITGVIAEAIEKSNKLKNAIGEINSTYSKETSKLIGGFDKLISRIQSATAGTKAYNEAMSTLQNNYGEYLNTEMLDALAKQKEGWEQIAESIRGAIREVQNYNNSLDRANAAGENAVEEFNTDNWLKKLFGTDTASFAVQDIINWLSLGGKNNRDKAKYVNAKFGLSDDSAVKPSDIKAFFDGTERVKEIIEIATKNFVSNKGKTAEDLRKEIDSLYGDDGIRKVMSAFVGSFYDALKRNNGFGKYLFNLEQAENSPLNIIRKGYADAIEKAGGEKSWTWKGLTGLTTDASEYRNINKFSSQYNPVNWNDKKQEHLINATIKSVAEIFGEEAANVISDEVSATTVASGKPYAVVSALGKLQDTLTDHKFFYAIGEITKQFSELAQIETGRTIQVNERIRNVLRGENSAEKKDFYNRYFASDSNYRAMEDKVEKDRKDTKAWLQSHKKGVDAEAKEYERYEREDKWFDDLFGRVYQLKDKPKGGGGASGGGWQRFLADLFSYIKEARAEEKKLVEHSAGLTEDLANQINSDQLQGTAVDAFWESMQKGGSPFKKIIDKMDEYGIESTFFDKDFLKGALSDIVAQSIKSTGTVDFQNVWQQLIKVINDRANELLKNPSTKKLGESIKAYAQQATVEGEKYFGRDAVQKLIEDQLKELRKINGQFENIRSTQNAINSIRGASNAYRAYGALGSRGYTSSADVTRQQLQALLGAKGGQGLSMATPLAQLINGGSLGINSISQILAIKESLAGITTKDMQGDDEAARQANFDEFKGVLGQFDSLLGQLTNDILEDFKRIMAARDPFMKAGDDIVNAFDEYSKTIALIAHGLANGDIDKSRRDGMMVQATQNLYTAVAKSMGGDGMPEYINRLFPEFGTATGTSNRGFELGMWLGNGSLTNKIANYEANKAGLNPDDYDTEKEFLEAVDEAANGVLKFAAKMELASAIVQKVDSYIQKSAQFANKLIDALDANNGLVKDEYGNYTYENDYSTAKEAINMISEFSSGISGAFQSLLSGDIFGAITGIGTAIAGFFENLFGIGDSQIQKQQDKIISANKSLERAMTNLQHTLQDVAGKDKWDNLTNQISNLREQQSNNKELENLEVSKKHGDADKAESYREASEQAAREAENTIRQIREEVLGVADDIAGQFTDAFTEAFRNGENLARAWRDSVRSYIADTLKDVLLKSVVAPRINDIFKKFGIEEGKTSSSDIIAMMSDPTKMKEFRNDLFAEGTFLQDWLTGLPKEIQEMIGYNGSTSELSGGIQGITEDTARTLEGLSNSILAQHVITNRYLSDMAVSGFAQVQLSWFTDMQNLQRQIASNTRTVSDVLTGSRDGIRSLQVRIE